MNIRLAVSVVILSSISTPANTADPVGLGGLALGVALDRLMDQLNTAIISARNAGNSVVIEAGREAAIAISNAKNAYAESLSTTVDKLNPTIKGSVDQLEGAVNDLLNNTFGNLEQFTARTQQIVNALPFREHEPQLTRVSPRYVVPARSAYPVMLRLQGNFEFASRSGFAPKLKVRNREVEPASSTTQELVFSIPVTDLFPLESGAETAKFQYSQGELVVPWQTKSFFGLFKHRHEDKFRVFVGALPLSPGQIKLVITTHHTEPGQPQPFTTSDYRQCSTGNCGNNDDLNHPYAIHPHDGCHVVRNTSSFKVVASEGDWSRSFTGDAGDVVSYSVSTVHHAVSPFGHNESGAVTFNISFQEVCPRQVTETREESVQLAWGDSRVFQYAAGTWMLVFDAFDKTHAELVGPNHNAFLRVRSDVSSLTIATVEPASLVWP